MSIKGFCELFCLRVHHSVLYCCLACADCALCAEAVVTANWLAAVCTLMAGMAYFLLASHSWAQR